MQYIIGSIDIHPYGFQFLNCPQEHVILDNGFDRLISILHSVVEGVSLLLKPYNQKCLSTIAVVTSSIFSTSPPLESKS